MGSVSFDYLLMPVVVGSIIVVVFGIILNKFILKRNTQSRHNLIA